MSGLCSAVQLSSTPPLPTPSPCVRPTSTGKRLGSNNLVSFRSGLPSDDLTGSFKNGLSRSLTESGSSYSLSRSLGGRGGGSGGAAVVATPRAAPTSEPVGASIPGLTAGFPSSTSGSAVAARPLQSTRSIPKSATFVKIEGFATHDSDVSPASSAPPSPQQPRVLSSLLSRQLSSDRLPLLGSAPSVGLDDPTLSPPPPTAWASGAAGLEARTVVRVAPVPRPAPLPRRATVPADLLQRLQSAYSVFGEPVVVRAFSIARFAHDGKYRATGEPAFLHCVEVAKILAELGADDCTVAAALLHDVLDKTLLVEGQLRPMLQDDKVAELVKQVSHLGDVSSKYRACPATSPDGQTAVASSLVGMLVAMGCNHALLVKLADRLHDMRTLGALPAPKRARLAQETIDVWAPLANRLGVWSLKAQLEDLAFKQLYPGQYAELRSRLEQVQSADVLVGLMDKMRSEMQRQGISYHDLSGRPKHLWGVYKKMLSKGYSLGRISDVRGLRIIVDTKADCYRALRAVETVWKAVGPTKDYIRRPKENGYRSLHTVVRGDDGHDIEVQIRTAKMHFFAEYGAEAAHWQYKERCYGTAGAAGSAAASLDEDGSLAGAAAGGAAREANWAKFVLSQQVHDQKCRPSGSPSQDQSLATIVGSAAAPTTATAAAATASTDGGAGASPSGSPPRDERFAAYLERSGQKLEPPPAERVVVAVVRSGRLAVLELPQGTTVAALVQQQALGLRDTHVLVNKQVESSPSATLHTGDIVELYPEVLAPAGAVPVLVMPPSVVAPPPAVLRPAAQPQAAAAAAAVRAVPVAANAAVKGPMLGTGRSNVLPLAGLKSRLRADAN